MLAYAVIARHQSGVYDDLFMSTSFATNMFKKKHDWFFFIAYKDKQELALNFLSTIIYSTFIHSSLKSG